MSVKQRVISSGIAVVIAASTTFFGSALAQKKISHAEAWRLCKAELDKERAPNTLVNNERYFRGGACMHRYGYRL